MPQSRLPERRVLRCALRPDGQIAVFYKPTPETKQRAFVITKTDFEVLMLKCKDKHSMCDPIPYPPNELGFFIIEAQYSTINRLLKAMTHMGKEIQ